MLLRKIFLILISVLIYQQSYGQTTSDINHELYQLQRKMKKGDKDALFKIANYFDSKKELTEMLSYNHVVSTNESQVVRRIIEVNTLFTDEEIIINDTTSKQDFLNFLNANKDKIYFSEYARAFLITPLEQRNPKVMFRAVTKESKSMLKNQYKTSLKTLKDKNIDSLLKQKDPKVLLLIASELYKERDWLNSCYGKGSQYIKLLQTLTDLEIAVENERNIITWHVEDEYYSTSALNLLCYFSANYKEFKWNPKKRIFENNKIQIIPISKVDDLFQLLSSKKESKAMNAFIQLTTCDPLTVTRLAEEYEYLDVDNGDGLPTFPYRFLKQLVILTEYCKTNKIDFKGSSGLKSAINKLKEQLSFPERRKLEDRLINNLTLNEITAFEYWSIIYEDSWGLTYSAGRILDVFYSKNWDKLLEDEKQLNYYLKKSALFDRMGIIGSCNNYLKKFANSSPNTLSMLGNHITTDEDIKLQIRTIISNDKTTTISKVTDTTSFWKANYDCEVKDFEEQLKTLMNKKIKTYDRDRLISTLLSQISYEQIPIALNTIENYSFETEWMKYSFMERDFGFFIDCDFDKAKVRKDFLKIYSKSSEYELYSYYLNKAGIDYKTNNELDFDKIFELIKYDVVVAFVGGGSTQDNEVYSLIKLLEIHFNTTLGFPKKLCNSNNIYGCHSRSRVKEWMNYFADKKILKTKHNEPISFNYE